MGEVVNLLVRHLQTAIFVYLSVCLYLLGPVNEPEPDVHGSIKEVRDEKYDSELLHVPQYCYAGYHRADGISETVSREHSGRIPVVYHKREYGEYSYE